VPMQPFGFEESLSRGHSDESCIYAVRFGYWVLQSDRLGRKMLLLREF
jgi:hypothetical protein